MTRTVADAMIRTPHTCGPATTVAEARAVFADDHIHAVLVVDGAKLLAVVERADLDGAAPAALVRDAGKLAGRVVGPDGDAEETRVAMVARRHRRVAVVDAAGDLLGLLCLKRSGTGFCSPADVAARAAERSAGCGTSAG
ncbi:CBS domain-containing protein [Pseudonocardia sp. CA-107938]|uniref:CBS domain-containing protein n=1 Tax=Pseudonocardia sp. CA-107938 TaxID=3240021 RepID=UPI003D8CF850